MYANCLSVFRICNLDHTQTGAGTKHAGGRASFIVFPSAIVAYEVSDLLNDWKRGSIGGNRIFLMRTIFC